MSTPNDILDEVLVQVRKQNVPPFPRNRVVATTVRALREDRVLDKPKPQHQVKSRAHKYQYYFAAALILLALGAGVISRVGPFSIAESFAFEQVLNTVRQVKSVSYTVTTTGWKGKPWPDPLIRKVIAMQPGMSRYEDDNEVQIINAQAGRFLRLEPKTRTATIQPLYSSADGKPASIRLDEFAERLRNIPATAKPQPNQRTINGRTALPFALRLDNDEFVVYVDATTKLPLRMEVNHGKRQGKEIKEIYDDFVFDSLIDPSIFEPKVPPGYTLNEYIPDQDNKTYPKGDTADLIVTPTSIGPVKSGMRSDEIVRLLGRPDWMNKLAPAAPMVVPRPDPVLKQDVFQTLSYDSRGFVLTIAPGGFLTISCMNQAHSGPTVRDFMGRTAEGIRLGDTRELVLKTYGKSEIDRPDSLMYVEFGWQFFFRDDKLCGMSTNMPMPRRRADGVQTRVLKDGTILTTAPGVDIDAMIDEGGNQKAGPRKIQKRPDNE